MQNTLHSPERVTLSGTLYCSHTLSFAARDIIQKDKCLRPRGLTCCSSITGAGARHELCAEGTLSCRRGCGQRREGLLQLQRQPTERSPFSLFCFQPNVTLLFWSHHVLRDIIHLMGLIYPHPFSPDAGNISRTWDFPAVPSTVKSRKFLLTKCCPNPVRITYSQGQSQVTHVPTAERSQKPSF